MLKSSSQQHVSKDNDHFPVTGSTMSELKIKSDMMIQLSQKFSTAQDAFIQQENVFEIKQKSHEELNIEIQSSRVLYVLDELIRNLEIVASIPTLLENDANALYRHLPVKEADYIVAACYPYVNPAEEEGDDMTSEGPSVFSASSTIQKLMSGDSSSRDKSHVKLNTPEIKVQKAIAVLCQNQNFKKNFLRTFEPDMLSGLLIDGVKRLRNIAEHKLSISANEERERERELRKAWKENAESKLLIQSIQEKIDNQREKLDVELNAKTEQIDMYKEKIETVKKKFKEDIKKRITNSEKTMIQKSQESEEKQTGLQQEVKEITHSYWVLLDQHLASEKVLRAKRYKVEAQLHSWISKYDQDIGEKQTELEDLQKSYDEEQRELNSLQKQFDDQEEEYLELMAERDEYDRKEYEEKAIIFLRNRAARRIQRYWRAFRERRRRRKKKGKKKEKGSASGGSGADSAKKGKKGKKKDKKAVKDVLQKADDPNAKLETAFKGHVFEDIDADQKIPTEVKVDL